MKSFAIGLALVLSLSNITVAEDNTCSPVLDFTKRYLASEKTVRLCDEFRNQVLLIVNTASYCGFTPQYQGLESLYEKFRERGFSVLGFPSNDFFQEPSDEDKVQDFCRLTYNVKFPMFEKSHVAKWRADPLFHALAKSSGKYPRWNFYKYLLSRDGEVVAIYGSSVDPENNELMDKIESLL